jgi:hypothetical protein
MVIIVGYRKRVGKDSLYQIVKDLYPNKKVIRVAFADALKDEIYQKILKPNNLDKSVLELDETKAEMRPFMQWYGTQFKRNPLFNGDPDHWINKAIEKIQNYSPNFVYKILRKIKCVPPYFLKNNDVIFVITDGRFSNEITKIKSELNAIAINITRDSVFDPNDQHISETELDNHLDLFDYTISNNTTIEEYRIKIKQLMDNLIHVSIS